MCRLKAESVQGSVLTSGLRLLHKAPTDVFPGQIKASTGMWIPAFAAMTPNGAFGCFMSFLRKQESGNCKTYSQCNYGIYKHIKNDTRGDFYMI